MLPGCLLGLVLASGLSAQQLRIGDSLFADADIKWLRPVAKAVLQEAKLLVYMPTRRWQYVRALRALGELQSRFGDRMAIAGLLGDQERDPVKLRLRKPVPLIGMAIDVGDRLRAALDRGGTEFDLAQAMLCDRQGRLLWIGELDAGLSYLLSDYLAGIVDAAGLCRLVEIERGFQPGLAGSDCPAAAASEHGGQLESLYWQPWVARMRAIPGRAWNRDGPAVLRAAITALRERPEFLARILRRALDRSTELAEQPAISAAIQAILIDSDSAEVDLLGFIWHAQRHEDGLARSRAIRYIDRFKGVPIRLLAFHRRLGKRCYDVRFVRQQLAALELASPGGSPGPDILRDKFNLLVGKLDALAAADRVGRELIGVRAGDISFLNSFAWSLLTESPFKGRMNGLALHAAEVMREQDGWSKYWRFDTLALALFENGRVDEAIEIQERALAGCEVGSRARYAGRLERYQRARSLASPGK